MISLSVPLISIIVAVYNVQEYLQKCLESIAVQEKGFEVILIDDGSTDHSARICDEWAKNKNFARVFHQANQGISKTRNLGVKYSNGHYITFVDPDDWVDKNFIKTLKKLIEENGSFIEVDAVAYNYCIVESKPRKTLVKKVRNVYPDEATTGLDALRLVLETKVSSYGWQYTFNKSLYINHQIDFPDMFMYEDAATIYRLLFYSKKVICTNDFLYYYFRRNTSFSHTASLPRTTEYFKLFTQMHSFFESNGRKDLIKQMKEYELLRCFTAYINMVRLDLKESEKEVYYKRLSVEIRKRPVFRTIHISTFIKEFFFYTHLFKIMIKIHDKIRYR